MKKFNTRTLTIISVLVAVEIVLSRFLSINAWNIKIGFGFIPVVFASILLGPVCAGIVGALGDLIGAVLFPIGAYFPGFTLTAFLTGMVYGWFLHKNQGIWQVVGAVLINQFILSLFLNTLWISVLYNTPYLPLLAMRVIQSSVLAVTQIIVIPMIARAFQKIRRKEYV